EVMLLPRCSRGRRRIAAGACLMAVRRNMKDGCLVRSLFRCVDVAVRVRHERYPLDAPAVHVHDTKHTARHDYLIADLADTAKRTEHEATYRLVQVLRDVQAKALVHLRNCHGATHADLAFQLLLEGQ